MHIGLLEDNPAIQAYLQKALELNGHRVTLHEEGISLLDTLFHNEGESRTFPYDLVIIDLNLPGALSGWDVTMRIRARFGPQMLPIIILSGAERRQLERLHTLFPDIACLQKPFKLQQLLSLF